MAKIIHLFDNPIVERKFFDQIKEIKSALIRNDVLIVRLTASPVPRKVAGQRNILELTPPEPLKAPSNSVVPPTKQAAAKLWFHMWLPGHKESEIRSRFAKIQCSGPDLILTSRRIVSGFSDILLLSESTMLWIHGPDNRSWLANFAEIKASNTLFNI